MAIKKINYVSVLQTVLREEVVPLMKQYGYTKRGNIFYKKGKKFTKIINFQKNRWNLNSSASCTINIAVYVPTIDGKAKNKTTSSFPKEYECKLRYRIGELIAKVHNKKSFWDKWYDYDQKNIIHITTTELLDDLQKYALPFLDTFINKENIVEFLRHDQQKYFRLVKKKQAATKHTILKNKIQSSESQIYQERYREADYIEVIEQRIKTNQPLTKDDLIFLYELNAPIQGLTYDKDPRVDRLKRGRNILKDMCAIFECTSKQIAHNKAEVTTKTKAYVGKLYPGIFTDLSHLDHIYKKFPDQRILKVKINKAEKTISSLQALLNKHHLSVEKSLQKYLKSKDLTLPKPTLTPAYIIELNLNSMGFDGHTKTMQLFAKAKQLGLELCPVQIGVNYWAKRKQQRMKDDMIIIGMEPIVIDKKSYVFKLHSDINFLALYPAHPQTSWYNYRFVFCLAKKK